ncbi:hypothetical protein C2845_PM01G45430 [Panicum miliaceum]|uniref:Uncharacterized protein n=1 Tax=Panicum miliaceum TaxID=4540 RepID=A0A3L6TPH9_PANMI|nr:hypothetical protein C2845_PM01G45430 [Panicum miliaceum]
MESIKFAACSSFGFTPRPKVQFELAGFKAGEHVLPVVRQLHAQAMAMSSCGTT